MSSAFPAPGPIGRYQLQGELGRGSMGVVYSAIDPTIGRKVAVKVINLKAISEPGEAEFMRDRLVREASSCGRLSHPSVVVIYDIGQQEQLSFIAMELVEGTSLQKRLANGARIPAAEAIYCLRQIASALDYAHQNGVIHRDVKPGNVLLKPDGTVKVVDFGIAKIVSGRTATMTGLVMGTPSYMSPEQIEGQPVDGRSDQFSLAVVAYEMLAGAKPFQSDSLPTLAHMIVYGPRPALHAIDARIPAAVDEALHRAFSKQPEQRFASCSAFVEALAAGFVPVPVRKQKSSGGLVAAILAGVLAVLMATVGAGIWFFRHQSKQAEPAVTAVPEAKNTPAPPLAVPEPSVPKPTNGPATVQPVIRHFQAQPATVTAGATTTLSWEVTGIDFVTIDPDVGRVPAKGTTSIAPKMTTNYTLRAADAAGTARDELQVMVRTANGAIVTPALRAKQLLSEANAKRQQHDAGGAATLYEQAAELGSSEAMEQLGDIYSEGGNGVAKDEGKAALWNRKAAEHGNAEAMVTLGAESVEKADYSEAARWFQKAAEKNNAAGLNDLGTLYESGRGVPKDLAKAKELYTRAAQLGNRQAQKKLAKMRG